MSEKNINLAEKKRFLFAISTKTKKYFDKILVSKKEPYSTNKSIKYLIEYNYDDIIRPLIMIPLIRPLIINNVRFCY